jgi:hypothetical protein
MVARFELYAFADSAASETHVCHVEASASNIEEKSSGESSLLAPPWMFTLPVKK